jgi:hypothetical protein
VRVLNVCVVLCNFKKRLYIFQNEKTINKKNSGPGVGARCQDSGVSVALRSASSDTNGPLIRSATSRKILSSNLFYLQPSIIIHTDTIFWHKRWNHLARPTDDSPELTGGAATESATHN